MKFENTRVMNFENALRGMRNPKESYHLIDSAFGLDYVDNYDVAAQVADAWCEAKHIFPENTKNYDEYHLQYLDWLRNNGIIKTDYELVEYAYIGPNDMKLAQTLIKSGAEHRKFMRQIFVSVDITAPLYW